MTGKNISGDLQKCDDNKARREKTKRRVRT